MVVDADPLQMKSRAFRNDDGSIEQKRATETDIDWSVGTRYLVFLDASGNEVERL
jgi:hypothetical protein